MNSVIRRRALVTVALISLMVVPVLQAGDREAPSSQKILELEKTIAVLRSDNAALRAQLADFTKQSSPAAARPRATEGASPSGQQHPNPILRMHIGQLLSHAGEMEKIYSKVAK